MEPDPIIESAQSSYGAASTERSNGTIHPRVDRAHQTVDRLASAAHDATDSVAARGQEWLEVQDRLLAQARDYVREKPLTAIGIALAAGFVLSRLSR